MPAAVAGPEIERLIQLLARLPGLGPRSARRAALHLIKKREALMTPLSSALQVAIDKIQVCKTCGNIDTQNPCTVCTDPRRDGARFGLAGALFRQQKLAAALPHLEYLATACPDEAAHLNLLAATLAALGDYERVVRINQFGCFLGIRAAARVMTDGGSIVNLSSVEGLAGMPYTIAYAASKFALDGMTACLAAETAASGVMANCVAPGYVDTELTRSILGGAGMTKVAKTIPAKRLARPEEIAAFVAWLSGPENTYISGQSLAIDGGFTRV